MSLPQLGYEILFSHGIILSVPFHLVGGTAIYSAIQYLLSNENVSVSHCVAIQVLIFENNGLCLGINYFLHHC